MPRILLMMGNAASHYTSSFKLASDLKYRGYEVTYAGEGHLAAWVKRQGFEFEPFDMGLAPKALRKRDLLPTLWESLRNRLSGSVYPQFLAKAERLDQLIRHVKPDLVLLDAHLGIYAVLAGTRVPFVSLSTTLPTERSPDVPPLNKRFIPDLTVASRRRVERLWRLNHLKRAFGLLVNRIIYLGQDNYSLIKRKIAGDGLAVADVLNDQVAFYPVVRRMPELIAAPAEFDFPWQKPTSQQYYAGPMVDLNRKDRSVDPRYEAFVNKLEAERRTPAGRSIRLVYCCMGTLAGSHNRHYSALLDKVVNALKQEPGLRLVISLGVETSLDQVQGLPANAEMFSAVPQLDMLSRCDVMITHGGLNSLKECVLMGVPMVVYPLNERWDQAGNSARVVFHGLGLRGDAAKDSGAVILGKVKRVLDEPAFKEKVQKMSTLFKEQNKSEEAIRLIESWMSDPVAGPGGLPPPTSNDCQTRPPGVARRSANAAGQ